MLTPPVDLQSVNRVLIVKLSAMGDILHALPVAAALTDAFPHLELWWAVEQPFVPLLEGNPCLDGVLPVPKLRPGRLVRSDYRRAYGDALKAIRHVGFDVVLDLQGLTKSALIALVSGAKVRLGYGLRELAGWVEKPCPPRPDSVHIVDQYLDVAQWLGAEPATVRFPFTISEADYAHVDTLLCAAGIEPHTPFVTVNPASARAHKQWGAARYAALMNALREQHGLSCVLVTADAKVAEEVRTGARLPFGDLSGRTSLKQLAAVLERGAVHLCGDTGSGHLAAALGRPVISLFGPTDPDRSCPYGQRDSVVAHREQCDPKCTGHRCQFVTPRCMEAITVEEVCHKVRDYSALTPNPSPR